LLAVHLGASAIHALVQLVAGSCFTQSPFLLHGFLSDDLLQAETQTTKAAFFHLLCRAVLAFEYRGKGYVATMWKVTELHPFRSFCLRRLFEQDFTAMKMSRMRQLNFLQPSVYRPAFASGPACDCVVTLLFIAHNRRGPAACHSRHGIWRCSVHVFHHAVVHQS
jgi:hypothetical protein